MLGIRDVPLGRVGFSRQKSLRKGPFFIGNPYVRVHFSSEIPTEGSNFCYEKLYKRVEGSNSEDKTLQKGDFFAEFPYGRVSFQPVRLSGRVGS